MYERFYGLARAPFQVTPDPEFLYLSPTHKHALASIVSGVERRRGFVLVLGDVGLGKTTVLRAYLEGLDPTRFAVAVVFNADVSFKALLDIIWDELGLKDKPDDVHYVVNRLHEVMIEEYHRGRNVVLVIDEVQDMPAETLERLRLLSNLETTTEKLLQIVLVGQSEFTATLDLPELRQLRQRIAVRSTLSPFTREESLAYVEHRLNKVGESSASVFTAGALRKIVGHARGVPRLLNIVCDNAMLKGYERKQKPVGAAIVKETIGDLTGRPLTAWRGRGIAWISVAALAVWAILLISLFGEFREPGPGAGRPLPVPPPAPARLVAGSLPRVTPPPLPGADGLLPQPTGLQGRSADVQPPLPAAGVTRIVQEGDSLLKMAASVYGFGTMPVVQRVLEANPSIRNPDHLLVGTPILFPDISGLPLGEPPGSPKGR